MSLRLSFVLTAALIAGLALGFSDAASSAYAENLVIPQLVPGKVLKIQATLRDGSHLLKVSDQQRLEYGPERVKSDYYIIGKNGKKQLVIERAERVRFNDKDEPFAVKDGKLMDLSKGATIAEEVYADFAIDNLGSRFVVSQLDPNMESSALFIKSRSGQKIATIIEGDGQHSTPIFSPHGDAIYFISTRSGIASWYGVNANGEGLRQITNQGLAPSDIAGARFVPVVANTEGMRFLDNDTLVYDAGAGEWWKINFKTAKAEALKEK
ncbi:MAG: TolB family protein [Bradymonadia bacterium]|jgi:hypothetical protein